MSFFINTTQIFEFPQDQILTKSEVEHMFNYALQELCEHQMCYDDEAYEAFKSFNVSDKHYHELFKECGGEPIFPLPIDDFKKYTKLEASFGNHNTRTELTIKY